MNLDKASSTAKVIAASTILLDSDPRTAHLVAPGAAALCKRLLSRTRAERLLARSAAQPWTRAIWRWAEQLTHPGIMAHYWHRKRWIEARCRIAIDEGFGRVIVLGAGFDTLGCRLAEEFSQLDIVEIDHPATQRAKRRALEGAAEIQRNNLSFVELDLGLESIPAPLINRRSATVVIVEGVLMYLSQEDVDHLFASLRKMLAERIRIIFSFMTRWPDGKTGFRPRSWLVERWLRLQGEPFTWAIEPQTMLDFLAARGFRLVDLAVTRQICGGSTTLDGENLVLCDRMTAPQ